MSAEGAQIQTIVLILYCAVWRAVGTAKMNTDQKKTMLLHSYIVRRKILANVSGRRWQENKMLTSRDTMMLLSCVFL